jgi:hypothetical protein
MCCAVLLQAQRTRAKWPRTEIFKTMSQNKTLLVLSWLFQVFCHSNRKLIKTCSFPLPEVLPWRHMAPDLWMSLYSSPFLGKGGIRRRKWCVWGQLFKQIGQNLKNTNVPPRALGPQKSWMVGLTLASLQSRWGASWLIGLLLKPFPWQVKVHVFFLK